MAEELEQVQEQEPQGDAQAETDWKAEARKWEARAKKHEKAQAELDELKRAQMTEQEKITARAEAAEAQVAAYKAEAELNSAAREISEATGCPREYLELCRSREDMERMAEPHKSEKSSTPVAPHAKASKAIKGSEKPLEARDKFAMLFE